MVGDDLGAERDLHPVDRALVFTAEYCRDTAGGCSQLAKFDEVTEVKAVDDLTVEVTFGVPKPYPYGPFVGATSPILQKAQFADCTGARAPECAEANFIPIGTGPFRVTEFRSNDVICRDDFSVLYKRIPRMFAELEMGRADGRYPRLFRALTRANLLILDDWGPDRLNPDQRRDLMEIVEDRYNNAAILVTSQLPLAKWHDVIGEPTFADAILDRIVHNAHRIDLVGPSMRKAIAENINANAIDHTEQK